MEERTDQQWIRLLKQDDPQATRDLWALLFTYATNLESSYNGLDDPGGMVRDAAVRAYQRIRTRGLHQFRFECSFQSYCRVVVVREVLRLVKRQLQRQPRQANLEDIDILPDKEAYPFSNAREIRETLQPCLDRLTLREQETIDRLYIRGHTPQDIADQLAISRNYVNVMAWRARRKLRHCLEERGYQMVNDVGHL